MVHLVTSRAHGRAEAAALVSPDSLITVSRLNARFGTRWAGQIHGLLHRGQIGALAGWWKGLTAQDLAGLAEPCTPHEWGPLFDRPGKIWGIGLNYADHAGDLGAARPDEPASFMRPVNTISAPGAGIHLPSASQRVTAEAEMGLVMGRRASHIRPERALDAVAGIVPVLDLTAEDILQRNPRFLTRAKSFRSFFSFGPVLATLDEFPDLSQVSVATAINGQEARRNTVDRMLFDPAYLIAFHSEVFEWEPGDILSPGTPGAGVIHAGDVVEARVADLPPLIQVVHGEIVR